MTTRDRARAAANNALTACKRGHDEAWLDAIAAGIEAAYGPEEARATRPGGMPWCSGPGCPDCKPAEVASTVGGATPEPSDADIDEARDSHREDYRARAHRFARVRAEGYAAGRAAAFEAAALSCLFGWAYGASSEESQTRAECAERIRVLAKGGAK